MRAANKSRAMAYTSSRKVFKTSRQRSTFYHATLYATRSFRWASIHLSVRPSVCLSNAWNVTKWKHLAKKVQISLIGSRPRAFQWAYDQQRTLPLSLQNAKSPFYAISKKVCYRVDLCENCQRQSCKAFTGLSIRAQIVGGLTTNFVREENHPLAAC